MTILDFLSITFEYGSSDNTKATGQIRLEGIVSLEKADTIYVQVKTNQGSLTVDEIVITYDDRKK